MSNGFYRQLLDFKTAVLYHVRAVHILEEIDAKTDLAEAYYQSGLTAQVMGEHDKSSKFFREAIRLFTEMEAPKQVERVRRSMEGIT
jgi:tetratricopeptide (TPR) repeat protein